MICELGAVLATIAVAHSRKASDKLLLYILRGRLFADPMAKSVQKRVSNEPPLQRRSLHRQDARHFAQMAAKSVSIGSASSSKSAAFRQRAALRHFARQRQHVYFQRGAQLCNRAARLHRSEAGGRHFAACCSTPRKVQLDAFSVYTTKARTKNPIQKWAIGKGSINAFEFAERNEELLFATASQVTRDGRGGALSSLFDL